ncbi:MAG: hypothetical protein RJA16_620 [Planctomycetota bacterium]
MIATLIALFAGIGTRNASATPADRPAAETAATAWVTARAWVDALEVPEATSENAKVPLEGVFAAGVVLRLRGQVVAMGEDSSADAGMLRRAVGRALADLAATVAGDLPAALRAELGASIALELDLCGEPVPLSGSTFETAADFIEPGRDAIALRRGETWHLATPGRLLAANLAGTPQQTLRRLAREADLPAAEVKELAAFDSIGLYRLPVLRLVQDSPGTPPVEAVRFAAAVPLSAIDAESVDSMSEAMLARLDDWMVATRPASDATEGQTEFANEAIPASLGLRGDYDPIADRHRPLVASPFEQAMVALALARLADASPKHRAAANTLLTRLVAALAQVDPIEEPVDSSPEAMATLAIVFALAPALAELDPSTEALAARCRTDVEDALDASETFASQPAGRQALVVAAAAAIASRSPDAAPELRALASSRLREAWDSCDASARVGLLPWFAMARRSLQGGIDSASLQALRSALVLRQLQVEAAGELAPDLVGGFDLREGPLPAADSRSNVAALGLAILLGDGEVTPVDGSDESMESLSKAARSHRAAVRFLRQLIAPDGGVTAAPWDRRQPVLAQAIGLWMLAESIEAGVP